MPRVRVPPTPSRRPTIGAKGSRLRPFVERAAGAPVWHVLAKFACRRVRPLGGARGLAWWPFFRPFLLARPAAMLNSTMRGLTRGMNRALSRSGGCWFRITMLSQLRRLASLLLHCAVNCRMAVHFFIVRSSGDPLMAQVAAASIAPRFF
jgi:hypothetical protein